MKHYSNEEIVHYLIKYYNLATQNELADLLECGKQNIYQFKQRISPNINTNIISLLIHELERYDRTLRAIYNQEAVHGPLINQNKSK